MAISAVLIRTLNESLSSNTGNSFLPRGTSTPLSDFISTATVSEKRNVTLRICTWTVPCCLPFTGKSWLARNPGAATQTKTHRARDIQWGKDFWNGESNPVTSRNFAPLAELLVNPCVSPVALGRAAIPTTIGPVLGRNFVASCRITLFIAWREGLRECRAASGSQESNPAGPGVPPLSTHGIRVVRRQEIVRIRKDPVYI